MPDPPENDDPVTIATPAGASSSAGRRATRPPVFSPGEVLAGRFRILHFIAQGGMGEVYAAEDQVLRDRVALKTIRADIAGDPGTMERFLREVYLARQVTHPNVSRIFDVFQHGETKFLTMELLSGETLADRIARTGRLTGADALPLVAQMASAIGAAHEAGVIHRDFKSANVMLVPDPQRTGGLRAVVTDFGLARRSRSGASASLSAARTETEMIIGTPDYMAPEQVEGGPITPSVDIYAFGVVLYELMTGDRPFTGESPITVAVKRLTERPPSPRALAPELDARWEQAILRCLERDPADRFANAPDIVRSLGGEDVPDGPGARRRRTRLTAVGIAAAVLLSGVAAYLAWRAGTRRAPAPAGASAKAPRRAIAVVGLKNLTGRPQEAWLSTALAELLTTELAAGEKLRAIPSEDVARMRVDLTLPETDALGRESLARVRRNLGADLVLLGSYLVSGSGPGAPVRLDLRLQDAAAGETIAVVSEKGTQADLDGLATRAGAQLRGKLGLGAVSETDAAAVKATLPSGPDAQRLYAEGLAKLRIFDVIAGRELLEQAVAADPDHALAHAALAAAWADLGYDARALAEAKTAFDKSSGLTRETRLSIEGRYREIANQWPQAIEIYRSLFTFFPDNLEYGLHLARAQARAGKGSDSLVTIAGLRRSFGSQDPRIDVAEASTALGLSDFQRMEAASASAVALGEKQGARLLVATANLQRATARRNLGDAKAALAPSEQSRTLFLATGDKGGLIAALNSIGNSRYDLGDLPGARAAYEEELAIAREIGSRRFAAGALDNIASVVGDQGDLATARRHSDEALAIYREIGDKAGEAQTLNNIGAALVVAGDFRGAKAMFEQAEPVYRQLGDEGGLAIALNNIAEMEADGGDVEAGTRHFQQALKIFQDSGQKSKAVYPAVGLAGLLLEGGDLPGARKILEASLPVCREAGDRHEEAYVLSVLGALDLAGARPDEAKRRFDTALAIREELGEKGAAQQSRLDLARVALASGRPADAATTAGAAAEEFGRQKLVDDEAVALAVWARALAEAGKPAEARRAAERSRSAAGRSQHDGARRESQLASAIVRAGSGDLPAARRALEAAIGHAREKGLVAWELEARLALGQIDMASGRSGEAGPRLEALAREARARGFLAIAGNAEKAASRAGGQKLPLTPGR